MGNIFHGDTYSADVLKTHLKKSGLQDLVIKSDRGWIH